MAAHSLLGLVMARSVRILLECFLVSKANGLSFGYAVKCRVAVNGGTVSEVVPTACRTWTAAL